MHTMPTIEEQYDECRMWADHFRTAGYDVVFSYTGEPAPFNREWQLWTKGDNSHRIASFDIDGCGASWHGPDHLWTEIIAPHCDMID